MSIFEASGLADVRSGMDVYNEESFGPLASLNQARDYEHAVALANDLLRPVLWHRHQ